MTLALAIPVHNDAENLRILLRQVAALGCFDQIVIIDDGSAEPLDLALVPAPLRLRTTLLRNPEARGAGQARNRALMEVTADRVLFFDADDIFTNAFPGLWHELRGQDFDFCIFKHHDSRILTAGDLGQMPLDDALWRLAGCASGGLRLVTEQGLARLAETANYPWNKVYSTGFLRDCGLRFSEIPVHNDIAAHWDSFSWAQATGGRVLASDRIAVTHFVHPEGGRLTNRRSEERLRVFEPLNHARIGIRDRQGGQSPLMLSLMRFSCGLLDWVRGNIVADLHDRFDVLSVRYLDALLEQGDVLDWVRQRDPVLALRMLLMMGHGGRTI